MARPLRVDLAGGWYHVTSRGNERRAIFHDERDRQRFVALVGLLPERFGVRVHAYVLMGNHYHLLVETPRANLSAAAQWLNVSYSVWFNRRHRRAGHLFQGRFKAVVAEAESWGLGLSRYIHLNPVRVARLGLDKQAQKEQRAGVREAAGEDLVRQRIDLLRGYRWSSYRGYAGLETAPGWLTTGVVLELSGAAPRRRKRAYREYVESAVREGLEESPWEQLEAGLALGGAEFMEKLRGMVKGEEKEQPGLRELRGQATWQQVVAAAEKVKGEPWERFRDRHGDWGRDMALYVARRRCGMKLGELGRLCGGIGYTSVCLAVKRFTRRMEEDRRLVKLVGRMEADL